MLSDRARKALLDIRDNILFASDGRLIFRWMRSSPTTCGPTRSLAAWRSSPRRAVALPADVTGRHPHIAWRDIRDAGNIYRHDYDGVQERIVLETVRRSLPELLKAVEMELGA